MKISEAKAIAREWVVARHAEIPGFCGAFHTGSTQWQPGDAELSQSSDVDVMLVLDGTPPATKIGKLSHRGVILEVSHLPASMFSDPEAILGDYHLAGAFHTPGIILDPSGDLTRLQAVVSEEFAKSRWVYARCAHARDNVLRYIASYDDAAPFHEQVTSWVFATGVTTHVLLAAGLRNPTVRRRYAAARELLADFGRLDFYPSLLELLGCAEMTAPQVERHLPALAEVFDAAAAVIKSPFPFAADISPAARPIAIDGSREMIDAGLHREAMFWIVVTYARCQAVLHRDAPVEAYAASDEGFRALLGDLGIPSPADFPHRLAHLQAALPHVWELAEWVMETNPGIEA